MTYYRKKVQNSVEYFFVEINLRKKKSLLYCSYNPLKNSISNYVDILRRELNIHSSNYANFLLPGDFNAEMADPSLKEFCNLYSLKNLIKKPTYFKYPDNSKVIDLLLTNRPRNFCNSDTYFHNFDCSKNIFQKTNTENDQLLKLQGFFK